MAALGLLAFGCSSDDGLSRSEVDRAIEEAIADLPEPAPGMSAADVDAAIQAALDEREAAPGGVTMAQMNEAISDAMAAAVIDEPKDVAVEEAPPKSDPVAYTQHVVDQAVALYEREGREAVLGHVNDPANVDGAWYVFVVDGDDLVIGHYEPDRLGQDLKGWIGTDINGYEFGQEMLEATEDGKWVGYVYRNPAAIGAGEGSFGDFELKNAWVVRHDGLLFGSGWYINVDDFIVELTDDISDRLRSGGLQDTIGYFTDPQNLAAGFPETVEYYNNNADTADGEWLGFFAQADGTVVFHNDIANIGANIADVLGPAILDAPAIAAWITHDDNPEGDGPMSMRIRAFRQGDIIFGTGWYSP